MVKTELNVQGDILKQTDIEWQKTVKKRMHMEAEMQKVMERRKQIEAEALEANEKSKQTQEHVLKEEERKKQLDAETLKGDERKKQSLDVEGSAAAKDSTIQWLQEEIEHLQENVTGTVRGAIGLDRDEIKRKFDDRRQMTSTLDSELSTMVEARDTEIMQLQKHTGFLEQQRSNRIGRDGDD